MSSHALTHLSRAEEGTPFWVSHKSREFHSHGELREKKVFFILFFLTPITSSHRTAVIMFSSDDLSKIILHSPFLPASRLIALPSLNNKLNPVCLARCQATGAAAPRQKEIRTVACSPPHLLQSLPSTPFCLSTPIITPISRPALYRDNPRSRGESLHKSSGGLCRITGSPGCWHQLGRSHTINRAGAK